MNILQKVTLQILRKNKTRTWVTIIGILLSAAMFTAVTTCASSMQNFLLRTVIATEGSWHGAQYGVGARHIQGLWEREDVKDLTVLERIGYAKIGSTNTYKPYLMVCGFDEMLTEILPIHLISGRMPENQWELLLPAHLKSNGNVYYELGDTLTLRFGERQMEGWVMDQHNPFSEDEIFVETGSYRTYTVVGFYQRPSFEEYTAPGYTALTVTAGTVQDGDVYIWMNSPNQIYDLLGDSAKASTVNSDLLRYTGMSNEGSYNQVIYGMAAILMGIISFGSISLIYNAFSISVGERTKQFGILKTIGATKQQLQGSVIYEALVLSAVGIPLGILSGILGIWITLLCTRDWFDSLLSSYGVSMELYVSPLSVLIAAVICLVTVLISAWIPARRAIRMEAIDSVRQNADIALQAKKVRSPRWIYKIFGFEGMLADKNFKRNRKRYRATVASLFVSVVLFISSSSFCAYLTGAVDTVAYTGNYDLSYYLNSSNKLSMDFEDFRRELQELDEIGEVTYFYNSYFSLKISDADLTEEYLNYRAARQEADDQLDAYLFFLDDTTFRSWAEKQTGRSADPYFEQPLGIAVDGVTSWDDSGSRYETIHYLKNDQAAFSYLYVPEEIDGYTCMDAVEQNGETRYIYQKGDRQRIYHEEALRRNLSIGAVVDENVFGTPLNALTVCFPFSMMGKVVDGTATRMEYQMTAVKSHLKAEEQVENLIIELGLSTDYLNNLVSGNESDRALVGVINVFSYGFIILISLIALANVFNTISTNITLRRREFAMLRSVGMTEKGLNKMMNYECILYGVKGLSWGLAAAVGVTFLIYITVNAGVATAFYLPWYTVAIAVGSVFLVVFSTMLYAMGKIKKEDPIEALKNENI